jgi:hypothetical protein
LIAASYVSLTGITYLAARLTTWEATFRGLRLPLAVVLRAMDYHAAHYLPVAMVAAATVLGYAAWLWKRPNIAGLYGIMYLYVLCGEVVVCALYLFRTYWAAMRNLMYANR